MPCWRSAGSRRGPRRPKIDELAPLARPAASLLHTVGHNILLFVTLAALFAVSYGASYCCSVNQWTANIQNWDPQRNFYAWGWTAYDYTNMQDAFTAIENINDKIYNVTYIMLYQKQVGYRIIEDFGSSRCQRFQISTSQFQPFCVPNWAVYRGNMTIGATLTIDVFEWMGQEAKGYIHVTADGACAPVGSNMLVIRNPNAVAENYYNYVPSVDPNVFKVPSDCPN